MIMMLMMMIMVTTTTTTTTTTIIIIINGLVKLEPTYDAAIVGLSEYIKQDKDRLARLVQEYDAGKVKCSVPKEANLIKQNI